MKRAFSRRGKNRQESHGSTVEQPGDGKTVRWAFFCCMQVRKDTPLLIERSTSQRNGRRIASAVERRAFPTRLHSRPRGNWPNRCWDGRLQQEFRLSGWWETRCMVRRNCACG